MRSLFALLVLLLVWGSGLLAFGDRAARATPPAGPPTADGVVALTGASDKRIEAAMQLLEAGKARRLLVSGVNPEASREDVRGVAQAGTVGATKEIYDCCVDLGFEAASTLGNARETAAWARAKGYDRLILVTADYHMPRSLLELKAEAPGVAVFPYPVRTDLDARHWWRTERDAKRMVLEYSKYLAVLGRESLLKLGGRERRDAPAAPAEAPAE